MLFKITLSKRQYDLLISILSMYMLQNEQVREVLRALSTQTTIEEEDNQDN